MVISDMSNDWKQLTVCIILLLLILLWDLILFNNKKKYGSKKSLTASIHLVGTCSGLQVLLQMI